MEPGGWATWATKARKQPPVRLEYAREARRGMPKCYAPLWSSENLHSCAGAQNPRRRLARGGPIAANSEIVGFG